MTDPYYRGANDGRVEIVYPDGHVGPLPHCVYHSPTGFGWGYAGSGPSDLAASILAHRLNVSPDQLAAARQRPIGEVEDADARWVLSRYQKFKADRIARLPTRWRIDARSVDDWIAAHGEPRDLPGDLD